MATSVSMIVFVCCFIMAIVDAYIQPVYWIKSFVKTILFITLPVIYMHKTKTYYNIFKFKLKNLISSLALAFLVFGFIIVAYIIASSIFDFSSITSSLSENVGVDTSNFIFVTTYIALFNSILEEFFFRGFAFFYLRNVTSRKFAYLYSSFMFSVYHVAIMIGWFDILVFLISLFGLFIGGVIFVFINEKNENIYSSWLVHMFANFAINLIGFSLFGFI